MTEKQQIEREICRKLKAYAPEYDREEPEDVKAEWQEEGER